MRRFTFSVIFSFCILFFCFSSFGHLESSSSGGLTLPELSLSLELRSRDFNEGFIDNPDWNFGHELELSWHGFFIGLWGQFDLSDVNDYKRSVSRWEYFVGYEHEFELDNSLESLTLGIEYLYNDINRDNSEDTQELTVYGNLGCFLEPGFEVTWDFENDVWYGNFNINYDYEFDGSLDWLSITNTLELWWGNSRFNGGLHDEGQPGYKSGLTSLVYTVGAECRIGESVNFGPFVQMAWALNKDIRQEWKDDPMNNAFNVCYGLALNITF